MDTRELLQDLFDKRSIKDKVYIKKFLKSSYEDFRDPFDFENMEKIVEKILDAKEKNQKIFIYGDYDVDGISGASFLVRFFRDIFIDVDYYIPNRDEAEYGVSKDNIDYFNSKNAKLVITVDTGYNTIEDVIYARKLGIDVIVTDHHKTIKESFDDEILYLNPNLSEKYKFKNLSGAGVAFKLGQAICKKLNLNQEMVYKYIDIVMIGTIADVVPMIDENRIIVKNGLKIIKNSKVKGITYLLKYLKFSKKKLTTTDISYYISPLINSLGRVGISKMGADFFIKEDDFDLYNIIEEMKTLNKERRNLEKFIYDDSIKKIKSKKILENKNVIILSSNKWHPGVIGVVASRLVLKFKLPVILVAFKGEYGKASCRSIYNISIFNILSDIKQLLIRYGGHDLAAGFLVEKNNYEKVKEYIENRIDIKNINFNNKNSVVSGSNYDFKLSLKEINEEIFEFMNIMEPFGTSNNHPLFFSENVELKNIKKFGVESRHFNGIIIDDKVSYNVVGFDLAHKIDDDNFNKNFYNVVYYPEKIIMKEKETVQIILKDIL